MGSVIVREDVKEARIDAVVIRANGDQEDLGTIAYWHRSRLKRLVHRIRNI